MLSHIESLSARIKELEIENYELKKKQLEITEAKELYLKIFEDFPALIWRSRLDKLCDYFNNTWLEFTGRTMEQEFGNGWAEGVHPDDFDLCLQTYVTAFDKREAFTMEYRMKNKFGAYCWIRDFGRPFYDLDNSFLGYIGSCYDITSNKNNESQLIELNNTKDKFFNIIAHDLKSPFNAIVGLSQLLQNQIREKDYEKLEELVDLIMHSSQRATDLLINLTEWAFAQSGRMEHNPQSFDLIPVINEQILSLNVSANLKFIHIESQLPARLRVFADKTMISAVVRNLLSNAIKFTSRGGKINIIANKNDSCFIVSIKDNGVGISKEGLAELFRFNEIFTTLGTQKEKGTGLGLLICKEFIEKNKGAIWVESEPELGSTFNFTLPVNKENE